MMRLPSCSCRYHPFLRVLPVLIWILLFPVGSLSETVSPEAYLDLEDQVLSMEDLTLLLDANPALRKVDMFATVVEKAQIDYLADRYPHIEFGWTIHIPGRFEGHTVRTDQTAFSTLHGNCITHTSEDFSVLRYCRDLRALDLGHNVIDNLSFLSDLTEMRILILACNRISDLSPLSGLRSLEYVELFSNPISDLSPLYDLPHLMDLNIRPEGRQTNAAQLAILEEAFASFHIINAFTFGPALVIDGAVQDINPRYSYTPNRKDPRAAIGQTGHLSYVMVLAEGRGESSGATMVELAAFMASLGCLQAYNLDGGNSSQLVFGSQAFKGQPEASDRGLNDIIYFGSAVQ